MADNEGEGNRRLVKSKMTNVIPLPLQDRCELCNRRTRKLAYFDGQNMCEPCYRSFSQGFRDAMDLLIRRAMSVIGTASELK
jgi:hypothetical protein